MPFFGKLSQLSPGDVVEVRARDEILATLAADGTLDSLPFMPEMLNYCGQRFRVYKRADKTCDTIDKTGGRRMFGTVHLDDLRCDGSAHGGCEASCLVFWKEAWLKRVDAEQPGTVQVHMTMNPGVRPGVGCTEDDLRHAACPEGREGEKTYRCQATQLKAATEPLVWWDVRQYVRDIGTNGVRVGEVLRVFLFSAYRKLVDTGWGYRALIKTFDWFQARRGGTPWPYRTGTCDKSPVGELNLVPGELVRVKSYGEILATLNRRNRNRGLYFDAEMVKYCGGTYRVDKRVRRILDEKTGKMLEFGNPCIILQNVFCRADVSKYRLFCPRSIYPYWREIWLERAAPPGNGVGVPSR